MDRHERNVHMMKCSHDERQNERNISVLLTLEYYNRFDFKLYSIKIYCIWKKNPNQCTYPFLIFKVNNHETRNIISVRLKLKCLVFKHLKNNNFGSTKTF